MTAIEIWNDYRSITVDGILLLCLIASFWIGKGPEKASSLCMLGLFIASELYSSVFDFSDMLDTLDPGLLLIDILAATTLIVIAITANRTYTLWLAGLQIIVLMAHFARAITDVISPIAYVVMFAGPSYFQIIVLSIGIWMHYLREKRYGPYRSWRDWGSDSTAKKLGK